jgi:hypothetical protein
MASSLPLDGAGLNPPQKLLKWFKDTEDKFLKNIVATFTKLQRPIEPVNFTLFMSL